jgi:hypothetical protein
MPRSNAGKLPALGVLALSALLAVGCPKPDGDRTNVADDPAKVEAAKTKAEVAKAKTDAERTRAIRQVLLAQTLRPYSILVGDPRYGRQRRLRVDAFTTAKEVEPERPKDLAVVITDSWKLDDLVKAIKEMEEPGRAALTFEFDGGINVVLDRTNVTVQLSRVVTVQKNLKQAKEFAERMLEVVRFGRKLFDLMYRIS